MPILPRIAWRNVWRHTRRSIITAVAMGVGVAMSIAMMSFADGFLGQMFDTVVEQQIGHVQIHNPAYPRQRLLHETIREPAALMERISELPETMAIAPRAHGYALLAAGDEAAGAQLTGIDPALEARITRLSESIIAGDYLDGTPGRIMVGVGLAESLRVGLGDEIVAVTQAADGSMGNELFRVSGIYRTGAARLDRGGAFAPLEDIQGLFVLGDDVHELAAVTTSRGEIPTLLRAMRAELTDRDLLVRSWAEIDPSTAQMLEVTDGVIWIFLLFIFSVASLGILNTMLMSVFERIRELGVLQALGLLPSQVLRLVLWETLILSMLAAVGGAALGILLAWLLQTRGLDLSALMGDISMAGMIFEPVIFGQLRFDRVLIVVGVMFAVSFLASIWPAVRAARLDPIAAMRET